MCHTLIPAVGEQIGLRYRKPESWISALYSIVAASDELEIVYIFPYSRTIALKDGKNTFLGYDATSKQLHHIFKEMIKQQQADVIHVFGTENPDLEAFIGAATDLRVLRKVVIGVQGIISYISKHYCAYLPQHIVNRYSLRDLLRRNNIRRAQAAFHKRGATERSIYRSIHHVMGRTDWDEACVKQMNPDIHYHYCGELLRETFYLKSWRPDYCEPHSIFVSQSNYPLKGFHLMLEAFVEIKKKYPDAKLYTTGADVLHGGIVSRLKETAYAKYLRTCILRNNLQDSVYFLGTLSEEEMCERYLRSSLFVCCSSIENSSNSVGEAMMLGMPIIASDVGGIKNFIRHEAEGYLYPADEPYMIAYYADKIFSNPDASRQMGAAAKERAVSIYDSQRVMQQLLHAYDEIANAF